MDTDQAIDFLVKEHPSDVEAFNVITEDLERMVEEAERAGAPRLTEYFKYKIQNVLLAAIHRLKGEPETRQT